MLAGSCATTPCHTRRGATTRHFDLKGTSNHKCDLVMGIVCMRKPNGALVELHQHGHQIRRVSDNFPPNAVAQFSPWRVAVVKVVLHNVSHLIEGYKSTSTVLASAVRQSMSEPQKKDRHATLATTSHSLW